MENFIAFVVVIVLAIGLHEYCHAKFADLAGDPTPRQHGRVTLNPFNHLDPIGSIFILITYFAGFGIGWGRPVPMRPELMKSPRWDHFTAVAMGPISNLGQAAIFGVALRFGLAEYLPPIGDRILIYGVLMNIGMFLFNLIPIGPLDGMWLVSSFLPSRAAEAWIRFHLTQGSFLFLGIIVLGQVTNFSLVGMVIAGPSKFLFRLLTGLHI